MKKLLLVTLMAVSFTTMADTVNTAIFDSGGFVFSGSSYVSVLDGNVEGVANITEIRDDTGGLVWDNATEDLNVVFFDFVRAIEIPGLGGTTQFGTTGGIVNFFTNALNTFQATGDFIADSTAVSGGTLRLSASGHPIAGNTAIGSFSETSYSSNGQLDIVGGDLGALFNTSLLSDGSDITFNLIGDNQSTAGYDFSGSGSASVSAVPIPAAVWLFGSALFGLVGIGKRKRLSVDTQQ